MLPTAASGANAICNPTSARRRTTVSPGMRAVPGEVSSPQLCIPVVPLTEYSEGSLRVAR